MPNIFFFISDFFSSICGQCNFILHCILWLNIWIAFIALTTPKRVEKKDMLKWWMNELDPEFFCTVIKEGLETKVTYLALPLSLVQEKTKTPTADGGRERKKCSSSSFLLSHSVWPAFVHHSGVIYHVDDAWSSPCQRNPTQPCCRRSPRVCVRRVWSIMECIIKLKCEANLSSPPLLRLHMTLLIPTSLFYTYLFPPLFSCSLWPRLHACNLYW